MTRKEELAAIIHSLQWDITRKADTMAKRMDNNNIKHDAEVIIKLSQDLVKYIKEDESLTKK